MGCLRLNRSLCDTFMVFSDLQYKWMSNTNSEIKNDSSDFNQVTDEEAIQPTGGVKQANKQKEGPGRPQTSLKLHPLSESNNTSKSPEYVQLNHMVKNHEELLKFCKYRKTTCFCLATHCFRWLTDSLYYHWLNFCCFSPEYVQYKQISSQLNFYLSTAPYSEKVQHRNFTQTNFPIFNTKPRANYIVHNNEMQYRHEKGKNQSCGLPADFLSIHHRTL